jgi:hypothetical protein
MLIKISIFVLVVTCSINLFAQSSTKDSLSILNKDTSVTEIGILKDKKKEGVWSYYKENKLLKIENYENDILNGYLYTFRLDGTLSQVLYFKNGKLNGKANFYSTKGNLIATYGYINNTLTTFEYYSINKESPPYKRDFIPSY